jgi:quercetin dioxygenase-like cupin family protein
MTNLRRLVPAVLLAAVGLFLVPGRAAEPDPKIISYTLPENIPWQKGANTDTAILQGDPSKPGLYIQLTRWHAGNTSRPHSHPNDRFITVLSGTWWMGWGPEYKPDSMFPVKAGTYVVHHANQLHYDGAKDEDCVLYIVGMGPATSTQAGKGK